MVSKLFGAAPKVSSPAVTQLTDEEKKARKSQRNQFLTEGGVKGAEINQVGSTKEFGN
jgi:hypothetical protein